MEKLGPDVPWHFSAFHPDYKMMDYPPTPVETLLRAREIALKKGIRHVYVGNVHHEESDSTYCPACRKRLIGRDWYNLTGWNLSKDGKCPDCDMKIPGVFEAVPGDWGAKRTPVNMAQFN